MTERLQTTLTHVLVLGITLFFTASCYRSEIRTVEIPVGKIGGPECFTAIEQAIKRDLIPGYAVGASPRGSSRIQSIEADYGQNRVVITFDARHMAIKNLEQAILKAGFSIYDTDGQLITQSRTEPPEGCGTSR